MELDILEATIESIKEEISNPKIKKELKRKNKLKNLEELVINLSSKLYDKVLKGEQIITVSDFIYSELKYMR